MNKVILGFSAAAVTTFGLAQAHAASITVDDFVTNQTVTDSPDADTPNVSEVEAETVIGGFRELEAMNFNGSVSATTLSVQDSPVSDDDDNQELAFSNDAGESGRGRVTYDGQDSVDSLDTTGLGGVDLTAVGANPRFDFSVEESDAELFIELNAYDQTGGRSMYSETLPEGGGAPEVFFSQFEGDVDFTDIGALEFFVESESPNLDGILNTITVEGETSVIPLPATSLLLLGGLGGLPLLRMGRRRA